MTPSERFWQHVGKGKWIENLNDSIDLGDWWFRQMEVEEGLAFALQQARHEGFNDGINSKKKK